MVTLWFHLVLRVHDLNGPIYLLLIAAKKAVWKVKELCNENRAGKGSGLVIRHDLLLA